MAEHSAVNRRVVGSSPTWGAMKSESGFPGSDFFYAQRGRERFPVAHFYYPRPEHSPCLLKKTGTCDIQGCRFKPIQKDLPSFLIRDSYYFGTSGSGKSVTAQSAMFPWRIKLRFSKYLMVTTEEPGRLGPNGFFTYKEGSRMNRSPFCAPLCSQNRAGKVLHYPALWLSTAPSASSSAAKSTGLPRKAFMPASRACCRMISSVPAVMANTGI